MERGYNGVEMFNRSRPSQPHDSRGDKNFYTSFLPRLDIFKPQLPFSGEFLNTQFQTVPSATFQFLVSNIAQAAVIYSVIFR